MFRGGGGDNNRGPFRGGPRGGRGFNQGGFEGPARGGFDSFRGRGNFDQGQRGRGGFDQGPRGRGGFDQGPRGRGGFDQEPRGRGGFDQGSRGRGGFDQGSRGRGGFDQGQRGRGGFDQGQRGRGGFDQGSRGRGDYWGNQRGRGGYTGGHENNEFPQPSSQDRSFSSQNNSFENAFPQDQRQQNFRGRGRGGGGGGDYPPQFDDFAEQQQADFARNDSSSGRGFFREGARGDRNFGGGDSSETGPSFSRGGGFGRGDYLRNEEQTYEPDSFKQEESFGQESHLQDRMRQDNEPPFRQNFGPNIGSGDFQPRNPVRDVSQPSGPNQPFKSEVHQSMVRSEPPRNETKTILEEATFTAAVPPSTNEFVKVEETLVKTEREPALPGEDEPPYDDGLVILDWYNSDLNLKINQDDFCSANAMSEKGFGYVWAGARATYGATRGKVCYEVRIDQNCDTSHLEAEEIPNVLRCGWSIDDSTMQLGEDPFSYGFGGTAKISENCKFLDYGQSFGVGDVLGCYLDLNSNPINIIYTLNGQNLGVAFRIPKSALQGRALFPHVLTKNQDFTVNFGQMPAPLKNLLPDYSPIGQLDLSEGLVRGSLPPVSREKSEVLLMIGLPGAGKSYWALSHQKRYPQKKFNILGTNSLIERMKVQGLPRKRNYHGRWEVLISKCTECFNDILKIAAKRRRNYILDQTNVFPTARYRKMKDFKGFKCKAVVVVPKEEEFLRRVAQREAAEGKDVPDDAVLNMKANFVLPSLPEEVEKYASETIYTELSAKEASAVVEKYNAEAKARGIHMTSSVQNFVERNTKKKDRPSTSSRSAKDRKKSRSRSRTRSRERDRKRRRSSRGRDSTSRRRRTKSKSRDRNVRRRSRSRDLRQRGDSRGRTGANSRNVAVVPSPWATAPPEALNTPSTQSFQVNPINPVLFGNARADTTLENFPIPVDQPRREPGFEEGGLGGRPPFQTNDNGGQSMDGRGRGDYHGFPSNRSRGNQSNRGRGRGGGFGHQDRSDYDYNNRFETPGNDFPQGPPNPSFESTRPVGSGPINFNQPSLNDNLTPARQTSNYNMQNEPSARLPSVTETSTNRFGGLPPTNFQLQASNQTGNNSPNFPLQGNTNRQFRTLDNNFSGPPPSTPVQRGDAFIKGDDSRNPDRFNRAPFSQPRQQVQDVLSSGAPGSRHYQQPESGNSNMTPGFRETISLDNLGYFPPSQQNEMIQKVPEKQHSLDNRFQSSNFNQRQQDSRSNFAGNQFPLSGSNSKNAPPQHGMYLTNLQEQQQRPGGNMTSNQRPSFTGQHQNQQGWQQQGPNFGQQPQPHQMQHHGYTSHDVEASRQDFGHRGGGGHLSPSSMRMQQEYSNPPNPNPPSGSQSSTNQASASNGGSSGNQQTSSSSTPDYKALLQYLQFYQKQMGGDGKKE